VVVVVRKPWLAEVQWIPCSENAVSSHLYLWHLRRMSNVLDTFFKVKTYLYNPLCGPKFPLISIMTNVQVQRKGEAQQQCMVIKI